MLREGNFKLVYHVGMPPQLFDLASDPDEAHDLVAEGRDGGRARALEAKLRAICDPEEVGRAGPRPTTPARRSLGGRESCWARKTSSSPRRRACPRKTLAHPGPRLRPRRHDTRRRRCGKVFC